MFHLESGSAMLVLSRKNRESVVVGESDGFHRLLKVGMVLYFLIGRSPADAHA